MSPSWARSRWRRFGLPAHLEVELRPEELWIDPGGQASSKDMLRGVQVEPASAQEGGEPWSAVIAALERTLANSSRRLPLRVVLSDHFVRYALLPWSVQLVADAERLAFARLTLREIYGPVADLWDVCVDEQAAGQASFLAAADRGLMTALREIAARHRVALTAVVPALAERIERYRRALKARVYCVASAEPGRLTLAFRGDAGWDSVRSRRMEGALVDFLPAALRQEATAGATQTLGTLYLVAEHFRHLSAFTVPGWQIEWLSERPPLIATGHPSEGEESQTSAPLSGEPG